MLSSITTLDTISMFKDYNSLSEIILNQNLFNTCFNLKNNNKEKCYREYHLYDSIRKSVFGIERVYIQVLENINKYRLKIVFNAKILGNHYLNGINKTNILKALNTITSLLKDYFRIDVNLLLYDFTVSLIDYTKNIRLENNNKIVNILKSINYFTILNQQVKQKRTQFMELETFTMFLSNKEKYIVYGKQTELLKKENKKFRETYPKVMSFAKNILRFETRIKKANRIAKALKIILSENETLNIYKVLHSEINLTYERLYKYSYKTIKYNNNNNIELDIDLMEYKELEKYIFGCGYYDITKNDINLINKIALKKSKNKKNKTYYRWLNKIKDSINYYLCISDTNNFSIDFYSIFNNVMKKLKVA